MVIDDYWTTIGSGNFDNRSFRLNDEANLNVLGERFARAQAAEFQDDLAQSREVTLAEWHSRPVLARAAEAAANLIRWQL